MQPDQAKSLADAFVAIIEQEYPTTRRVMEAMPADKGEYTPDPKSMSAMQLAYHIAASEIWFLNSVADGNFVFGGDHNMPAEIKTPGDLLAWYEAKHGSAVERVKKMTGEDLAKILDFYGMFQFPAVQYLSLSMRHGIHHRGQLSAYLRPMGGRVPMIYGGSADEPIEAPASA